MSNPTASPADLLAEIQRLRDENELLNERNVDLETRLAVFEAPGGAKSEPPTCSICGAACAVCAASTEAEEEVVLPTELLLMIAEYFEPGTRNLLNLARSSRHLYDLLVPRLYKRIKVPDILSVLERAFWRLRFGTSVETGLLRTQVLDLVTPGTKSRRYKLICACQNLVELRIEFSISHKELFDLDTYATPRLEKLTVWAGNDLALDFPGRHLWLPKLRELTLEGTPSSELMELLANSLPDLEHVHLLCDSSHLIFLHLEPNFVKKIKSCQLDASQLDDITGMASFGMAAGYVVQVSWLFLVVWERELETIAPVAIHDRLFQRDCWFMHFV